MTDHDLTMKYPRILSALRSAKWAVTPATLQAISDTLSARLAGKISGSDVFQEAPVDDCEPPYEMAGPGVAVVELCGIIGKNLSSLEMACGGCDLGTVEENLAMALADPSVQSVILSVDSPGGTVNGVAEFAAKIGTLETESGKPVYAWIENQGCSAAYWIASGCSGIACSPSSDVGSIGVYMALVDESANWQKEGYKLVLIKAGEFKAAGIAGSEITDAQRALWQADIDAIYGQFAGDVQRNRPGVSSATMQGQTFLGQAAVTAGLVDKVLSDLEAMVAEVAPVVPTAFQAKS